jgi:hypothetical protein
MVWRLLGFAIGEAAIKNQNAFDTGLSPWKNPGKFESIADVRSQYQKYETQEGFD